MRFIIAALVGMVAPQLSCTGDSNVEIVKYEDVQFTDIPGRAQDSDEVPREFDLVLRRFLGRWEGRPVWREDGRPVSATTKYEIDVRLLRAELAIRWVIVQQFVSEAETDMPSVVRELLVDVMSANQDTLDFLQVKPDVFPKMTSVTVGTIRYVAEDKLELEEHTVDVRENHPQRDKWFLTALTRRE